MIGYYARSTQTASDLTHPDWSQLSAFSPDCQFWFEFYGSWRLKEKGVWIIPDYMDDEYNNIHHAIYLTRVAKFGSEYL